MGGWEGISGGLVGGSGSGESFWQVGRLVVQCVEILWRRDVDGDGLLAAIIIRWNSLLHTTAQIISYSNLYTLCLNLEISFEAILEAFCENIIG